MAIKRVTFELDDSPETGGSTGGAARRYPQPKSLTGTQTTSVETYEEPQIVGSDKHAPQGITTGRTLGDIVVEFKDDSRLMTVILVLLSFVVFNPITHKIADFDLPLALAALLNLIWHPFTFFAKRREKKGVI